MYSVIGVVIGIMIYVWTGAYVLGNIAEPFVWWKFPTVITFGFLVITLGAFIGYQFDKRSRKDS